MPLQSSVAESQGFEPWEDLTPRSISSAVPSTTRTTLHDDSLRHRPPVSCWKQERKTGEKTLESDIWTTSDVQQFQGIRVFLLPKCSGFSSAAPSTTRTTLHGNYCIIAHRRRFGKQKSRSFIDFPPRDVLLSCRAYCIFLHFPGLMGPDNIAGRRRSP